MRDQKNLRKVCMMMACVMMFSEASVAAAALDDNAEPAAEAKASAVQAADEEEAAEEADEAAEEAEDLEETERQVALTLKDGAGTWEQDEDDNWYYRYKGSFLTGFNTIGADSYYFYSDGRMATNTTEDFDVNDTYQRGVFGANGKLQKGWYKMGNEWYYSNPATGFVKSGIQKIGDAWYYIDYWGHMETYYACYVDGYCYSFGADGKGKWAKPAANGWTKVGNDYFYFKKGEPFEGWLKDGKAWYYINYGAMVRGTEEWIYDEKEGQGYDYRFASDGKMFTGWYHREGEWSDSWYYYDTNGRRVTGWKKIDNKWYYFNNNLYTNTTFSDENGIYRVDENGVLVESLELKGKKDGWYKFNDDWYYIENGAFVGRGWKSIKGKWYYFGWDGSAYRNTTSWIEDDNGVDHEYRFGDDCAMVTGWYKSDWGSWFYYDGNGQPKPGLQDLGYGTYYFDSDGEMRRDYTYTSGSDMYYFGQDGKLAEHVNAESKGWQQFINRWYYSDGTKFLKDTVQKIGDYTFGFDFEGRMCESTGRYINGYEYYFDENGHAVSGWMKRNGDWYYYGSDFRGYNGVHTIGGSTYCFNDAYMMTDYYYTTGDTAYYFGADGKATTAKAKGTGWVSLGGKWFYSRSGNFLTGVAFKDGNKVYGVGYNGVMYTNASGIWLRDETTNSYGYMCFDENGVRDTGWFEDPAGNWFYTDSNGHGINGYQKVDGKYYYFESGAMCSNEIVEYDDNYYDIATNGVATQIKNGWVNRYGDWYYLENGKEVSGWKSLYGNWYYFDNNMVTDSEREIDGAHYYFDSNGVMQKNGWIRTSYGFKYAKADGKLIESDWLKVGNSWFYFNGSATMVTGTTYIDGKIEYFKPTGEWVKSYSGKEGWFKADGGWFYNFSKSSRAYYAEEIDGQYYYFDENGRMDTDVYANSHYHGSDGKAIKNDWHRNYNGSWSYYDKNGIELSNEWLQLGKSWFYFDVNGNAVTEPTFIDGALYNFNDDGSSDGKAISVKTDGWKKVGSKYFYAENGTIYTGIKQIGNSKFFMYGNGVMAVNTVFADNSGSYYAGSDGASVKNKWVKLSSGAYIYAGSDGKLATGLTTISGKEYYFTGNYSTIKGAGGGPVSSGSGVYMAAKDTVSYDGKHLYLIGSNGVITKKINAGSDGWKYYNGNWYVVCNGRFLHDTTVYTDGETKAYYLDSTGAMVKDQFIWNGYAGSDGVINRSGWAGGYYYDSDKHGMAEGFKKMGSQYFRFSNGEADEGFFFADGNCYYYDGNGKRTLVNLKEGWNSCNGKWCYVKNGRLTYGTELIDGEYYTFNNGMMETDSLSFYGKYVVYYGSNGKRIKNTTKTIEGVTYKFDADGFAKNPNYNSSYYFY